MIAMLYGTAPARVYWELTRDPVTCERRLHWLAANAERWPFVASTTEAPQYRRVVIQRMRAAGRSTADIIAAGRGWGMRDGNGIMFISAEGDVSPSGFLPLVTGNVREASPIALYRDAPLFRALRAPPPLKGRRGACEVRMPCGGSRGAGLGRDRRCPRRDPLCTWRAAQAGALVISEGGRHGEAHSRAARP